MITTIGFTLSSIALIIFALTIFTLISKKVKRSSDNFAYAYFSVSLCYLLWGAAAHIANQNILDAGLIIGDIFMFLATLFLLEVELDESKEAKAIGFILGMLGAGLFLWWRIIFYPPNPTIQNGVLIFNTPVPVTIVLGALFFIIWTPANIKFSIILSQKSKDHWMIYWYSFIFLIAASSGVGLIYARDFLTTLIPVLGMVLGMGFLSIVNIRLYRLFSKQELEANARLLSNMTKPPLIPGGFATPVSSPSVPINSSSFPVNNQSIPTSSVSVPASPKVI